MDWMTTTLREVLLAGFSTVGVFTAVIVYTRLVGLRSFSKMSAFDFAMTVAVGSLVASTISNKNPSLLLGLAALAFLYCGQWLVALLRQKFPAFRKLLDNSPLLLMENGKFLEENLRAANVSKTDVHGKLREANVFNYEQVAAVVFESTGDVSVLHSEEPNMKIQPEILDGVEGVSQS